MRATIYRLVEDSRLLLIQWEKIKVISSAFYACAKQMFTCVFTDKYSDTSFRNVIFSRFLSITCSQNKTFSEPPTRVLTWFSAILLAELFTLSRILHVILNVKSYSGSRNQRWRVMYRTDWRSPIDEMLDQTPKGR